MKSKIDKMKSKIGANYEQKTKANQAMKNEYSSRPTMCTCEVMSIFTDMRQVLGLLFLWIGIKPTSLYTYNFIYTINSYNQYYLGCRFHSVVYVAWPHLNKEKPDADGDCCYMRVVECSGRVQVTSSSLNMLITLRSCDCGMFCLSTR